MEDSGINKEEKALWSQFKKESSQAGTPCLDDLSLAAYLEGRLLWGRKGLIEEHLAVCPDCLGKFIEMRSLLAMELNEAPVQFKQKAKDLFTDSSSQTNEADLAFWKFIFQPHKSLAWGVICLLIFTSLVGMKIGGDVAVSGAWGALSGPSNNLVESAADLLGVQDIKII